MTVGVLGAGALGLTAAYRLANQGIPVVVLEREDFLGGLAASFDVDGAHLERFYHHLFKTDRDAEALIHELGLGERLLWQSPRTSILRGGNIYHADLPSLMLKFSPLPIPDRLRMLACMAYLKLEGNYRRLANYTADAWIQRWMGPKVYDVVFGPTLRSKFGDNYDRVAMPWFWSRVHERTFRLGYVRGGFQLVYERLGEEIRRRGGQINLGTTVTGISSGAQGVDVEAGGNRYTFDRVISTLPTRLFTRLASGLPGEYLARYDWGDHFGAHCVILELDRQVTDTYWLNVNDPGYPFLVLVEHTNFMPASDYGGRHLIYLGNYLPMSSPRFTQSSEEILAEYLPAIRRIVPAFRDEWVRRTHVFKAPFAQPIVTRDYHEHIPPHETPLPGVFLANMFQVYPQDRGQNYSIRMANQVAEQVARSLASSSEPAIALP
jgi:protoporphyrinogen oxidase